MNHLCEEGFIGIHPSSDIDAFREGPAGHLIPILNLVTWQPLFLESTAETALFLDELRGLIISNDWPEAWHHDAQQLAQEVALHECLNILENLMVDRRLLPQTGPKVKSNLKLMLRSCSVGQCACIIKQCVTGATDYMVKEGVSARQAANYVPNQLMRRFQWLADSYDNLFSNKRTSNNLESEISHILFNLALGAGPNWFTTPLIAIRKVNSSVDQV